MDLFIKLFGDLLTFVYHCFDRIVIHGYLTCLCRPEHVVHFFREVVGVPVITKDTLRQRTNDYQSWVEAFARNHRIPIQWPEKGTRKEDYVLRWLRRMERKNAYGVYFTGFSEPARGPEDNRRELDPHTSLSESRLCPASRALDRLGVKPWTDMP